MPQRCQRSGVPRTGNSTNGMNWKNFRVQLKCEQQFCSRWLISLEISVQTNGSTQFTSHEQIKLTEPVRGK